MSESFTSRINKHVADALAGYRPTVSREKTIHDPIWGSTVFRPWEVRIIDSPLFQRLRRVNQLGLAETTYPAARHTRFEHSLGVAAVASRMMEQVRANCTDEQREKIVTEAEIRLVRLAAILHDVGHCPYSHLSEAVYGRMPEFLAEREELIRKVGQPVDPKPHEVFSYLIVTSDAFAEFFASFAGYPGVENTEQAKKVLKAAANMIIGAYNEKTTDDGVVRYSYLTSVINGNFDADKLDYTQRDSYTSGIALTYGVERFLLKLTLCRTEEDGVVDYRLAMPPDALSTVEELLFNRSMLYHYMYNHQKVLAAESQMRDAIYALVTTGKVAHPCDFLTLNNADLTSLYLSDERPFAACGAPQRTMRSLMGDLSDRELMKRAVELSPEDFAGYGLKEKKIARTLDRLRLGDEEALEYMVDTWERETLYPKGIEQYIRFLGACSMEGYIAERRRVAERIAAACREAGVSANFDAFDLAISFLPPAKVDLRLTVTDRAGNLLEMSDAIERIRKWTETLSLSKWRGYLFVSPRVDRAIAKRVFWEYLDEKIRDAE